VKVKEAQSHEFNVTVLYLSLRFPRVENDSAMSK
jgi:hypothetical protein